MYVTIHKCSIKYSTLKTTYTSGRVYVIIYYICTKRIPHMTGKKLKEITL